jgi:DNA-binding response OmpR family regulator
MERIQSVLVVEDDGEVADLIETVLQRHPYEVWLASSAGSAKLVLQSNVPDLMVLDLNLPDSQGFELLSEIKQTSDTPVIVCSGMSDQHQGTLRSLELGADDFIGKPFDAVELEARVEAVLRRAPSGQSSQVRPPPPDQLVCGTLRIDPVRRRVTCADLDLTLTLIEYAIVLALTGRPGEIVSHDELTQAAWGSPAPRRDKALSGHICSLRAKLGTLATISAVSGFGYRLSS